MAAARCDLIDDVGEPVHIRERTPTRLFGQELSVELICVAILVLAARSPCHRVGAFGRFGLFSAVNTAKFDVPRASTG